MMNERVAINTLTLQKSIQQSLKKPEAKEACLSYEYKLQLLYSSQYGIYMLPQLDTLKIWHGVIFVRFGLYKDAKFKFTLNFDQFPRKPPKVTFISQVYHPRVHPETGELDLGEELLNHWNYGEEHLVFNIIEYIRFIFLDPKKYDTATSFNPAAGELFKDNVDQFYIKIRDCVQVSKTMLYNNSSESSIKFQPFNDKHLKIKEALTQICEEQGTLEEKKKKFMKVLKE